MLFSIFEDWIIWSQLESLNLQTPVQYGPLRLVWNFAEFIGIEIDHTSKREIVPHNLFYKCANLQNSWAQKVFVFRVQIELYEPVSRLGRFLKDGLTFNYI
jgi:hypothetical protein